MSCFVGNVGCGEFPVGDLYGGWGGKTTSGGVDPQPKGDNARTHSWIAIITNNNPNYRGAQGIHRLWGRIKSGLEWLWGGDSISPAEKAIRFRWLGPDYRVEGGDYQQKYTIRKITRKKSFTDGCKGLGGTGSVKQTVTVALSKKRKSRSGRCFVTQVRAKKRGRGKEEL